MNMLQASKHQGHSSFKGNGRLCVANSLMSICQSHLIFPADWVQQTMDNILDSGDKLYMEITLKTGDVYISLEEVPKVEHSMKMNVTKSIPFCKLLNERTDRGAILCQFRCITDTVPWGCWSWMFSHYYG